MKSKSLLGTGIAMGIIAILAAVAIAVTWPIIASASPTGFSGPVQTAQATSTLAYMTPGTGTTTLSIPIASRDTGTAWDSAVLHYQVTATSTGVVNPTLNIRLEGSRDGVDWYPIVITGTNATTSLLTSDPYNTLSLKLSTSTVPTGNFGGTGTATRIHGQVIISAPERYMRAVFTDPTGGGNYGLWAEIYGKFEI